MFRDMCDAVSEDLMITGSQDGSIKIWHIRTSEVRLRVT